MATRPQPELPDDWDQEILRRWVRKFWEDLRSFDAEDFHRHPRNADTPSARMSPGAVEKRDHVIGARRATRSLSKRLSKIRIEGKLTANNAVTVGVRTTRS
jgi:hypothetical protein